MGFFSWECPACGHSIRHRGATNEKSAWMAQAVVLFPNGDRISGTYDGYGNVGSTELDSDDDFAAYHSACWEVSGKPEYKEPSDTARDQGHFVGDYDPVKPMSVDDCTFLKGRAK